MKSNFRLGILLCAGLVVVTHASSQDVTPAQVNEAIERGIRYLKARQLGDGSWADAHRGGSSALALVALLSCDLPADDPAVALGLRYMRSLQPRDTYTVGLQTICFSLGEPKKDLGLIRRNAEWLERTCLANGMWSYGEGRLTGGDNSNTQYALLGLQAASEAGVKIPHELWRKCRAHWERTQDPQGAWGYTGRGGATYTMATAGIGSLVITSEYLPSVKSGSVAGQPVRCKGPRDDKELKLALDWMARHFTIPEHRGIFGGGYSLYYLYGLERSGRLTGRRMFGKNDWYRIGADRLVRRQNAEGSWNESGNALWDTSFALLFLAKGRIPILINKYRYGNNDDWNVAPNNVKNLTKFMVNAWQKQLNWQIVESEFSKTEDLLQAPILHLTGLSTPRLTAKEITCLREFVDQGGTIIADANCSVKGFDVGFRDLAKRIFPEPELQLRPIEPGHAVWTSLFDLPANWPLEGINVGCRTAVFFSPIDLSCHWEHMKKNDPDDIPALRMGANIIAYATGPERLQDKLEIRKVIRDTTEDEISRGFLHIAKLKHNGDWNLAPKAVRNLLTSLKETAKVDVVKQQRDLPILDPNLTNYPLVYMHGRTRFLLSDEEIRTLAEYLQTNGVLFADACCSSEAFDRAFRETVKKMFPKNELKTIPLNHEIFTTKIGYDISKLNFNGPAGGARVAPALEGIEIDGRLVVIYSKFDLGCALEKQASKDCKGYDHESAIKLATNIVLYALKQ